LSVAATWTQFFGSLTLALLGIVIFHLGLFCLI
jgi:hypothetical protein